MIAGRGDIIAKDDEGGVLELETVIPLSKGGAEEEGELSSGLRTSIRARRRIRNRKMFENWQLRTLALGGLGPNSRRGTEKISERLRTIMGRRQA